MILRHMIVRFQEALLLLAVLQNDIYHIHCLLISHKSQA
jgi:hypothetical protein